MSGLFCWLQTSKALTPIKLRGPFGVSGSYFSIYHSFLSDLDHFQKREKKTVSHVVRKTFKRFSKPHPKSKVVSVEISCASNLAPQEKHPKLGKGCGFSVEALASGMAFKTRRVGRFGCIIQASNSRGVLIGNCAHELAIFDVKPGMKMILRKAGGLDEFNEGMNEWNQMKWLI